MTPEQHLEALLSLPTFYEASVSPDGQWVAWSWYRAGPTADVYVAPTDNSSAPIRLTATDQDTEFVSWAPDSRSVIVQMRAGFRQIGERTVHVWFNNTVSCGNRWIWFDRTWV